VFTENFCHYILLFVLGLVTGSIIRGVVLRYCGERSTRISSSACSKSIFSPGNFFSLQNLLFPGAKGDRVSKAVLARYFLPGLVSAALFLLSYYYLHFSADFVKYIVIFNLLLLISCIDLKVGLIPNRFVFIIFIWVLLWQLFYPRLSSLSALTGFLTGAGLFYIIAQLSKGGMGGGDVKLVAVLGLASGLPDVLIIIMLSFVLGAITGLTLIICRRKTRRDALPFAPFLSLAFILVSFWGREIWQWYLVSM
jgi:leader peptidase (prepilin peptidase)/N-methyltransferase